MLYETYYPSSNLLHGSSLQVMGTRLDALLIGEDEAQLRVLWKQMEEEVKRLTFLLNRFDEKSELSQLNTALPEQKIKISDELWTILKNAYTYVELTEGTFDITLGHASAFILEEGNHEVTFMRPNVFIDLGGYAKGYALRALKKLIDEANVKQALVNFGDSAILAVGTHPEGDYWPISISHPYKKGQSVNDLQLKDLSLSVSGNMPSHPRHILNPKTHQFIESKTLTWVTAQDPLVAEVLSTALMVEPNETYAQRMARKMDAQECKIIELSNIE